MKENENDTGTGGNGERGLIGVYIHIPFCATKCPYCDFNSVASGVIPEKRFVDCLRKEFSIKSGVETEVTPLPGLASIYIGGGTPSILSPESIGRIISAVKERFRPKGQIEVTMEANPSSVDGGRLEGFLAAGVNRLSVGVQSFDDGELKTLGRAHSAAEAIRAIAGARDAGFTNIGVDLIYGLPGQLVEGFCATVTRTMDIRPEHISLYNLTIEEGTPFYGLYGRAPRSIPHDMGLPTEEAEKEMFSSAITAFEASGYGHYEISNLSVPGYASVHNSGYWRGRGYIGLGPGAHSFSNRRGWGRRSWNEPDPSLYMDRVERTGAATSGSETLGRDEAALEAVMLGLRMLDDGLDGVLFRRRFGDEAWGSLVKKSASLEREGFIMTLRGRIRLTGKGLFFSNEVMARLFS